MNKKFVKAKYNYDYESVSDRSLNNRIRNRFKGSVEPLKKREVLIDLVRGFAVLLMIITHVVAVSYDHGGNSKFAFYVGYIGGLASFTTFLLLSGASSYFSILNSNISEEEVAQRKVKVFARSVQILVVYYILAFFSLLLTKNILVGEPSIDWLKDIAKIILFLRIPEFTEFLIPIIFFVLSTAIFRNFYVWLLSNKFVTTLFAFSTFFLGFIISNIDLANTKLLLIKAVISGHASLHTFPILQYAPIFILGIVLGEFLYYETNFKVRTSTLFKHVLALGIGTAASYIVFYFSKINFFNISIYDSRFPPALGFILFSVLVSFIFVLGFHILTIKLPKIIRVICEYASKYALEFLVFHTLVILVIRFLVAEGNSSIDLQSQRFRQLLVLYVAILIASSILIWIKNRISDLFNYQKNPESGLRSFIILILFIFTVFFTGISFLNNINSATTVAQNGATRLSRRSPFEVEAEKWWDYKYKARKKIIFNSNLADSLNIAGNKAYVTFDHKTEIEKNNSFSKKGEDIRLIKYFKNADRFVEQPLKIENPNNKDTIAFFNATEINTPNVEYYLYFGNSLAGASEISNSNVSDKNALQLRTEDTENLTLDVTKAKKWVAINSDDQLKYNFEIKINESVRAVTNVSYKVVDTNVEGSLEKKTATTYDAQIDLSALKPGKYTIQATALDISNGVRMYMSYEAPLFVTHPLFVTWTMDWEGFDVNQSEISEISAISRDFNLPLTQYFNPRIYMDNQYVTWGYGNVGPDRARYLTQWVLDRKNLYGDEIGLHIHLYEDVLKELDIDVRSNAQIIGINRPETYLQAYSEEELVKIFNWGIEMFEKNGLGKPVSFRSGAWMSGANVLTALERTGFLIDSSGRTGGRLNPGDGSSTAIPWNLNATTKPYKPNQFDINSGSSPNINIYEFPNNGADSFWFSLEELISRFDQNYRNKNDVLYDSQVVTYLSHPHGFLNVDAPKVRSLMEYISNYLYEKDMGPVQLVTIEGAYNNMFGNN